MQIRLQKDSEWTKWDDAAEQLSLVSSGLSAASDIYGFAQEREELVREIYQSPTSRIRRRLSERQTSCLRIRKRIRF